MENYEMDKYCFFLFEENAIILEIARDFPEIFTSKGFEFVIYARNYPLKAILETPSSHLHVMLFCRSPTKLDDKHSAQKIDDFQYGENTCSEK